MNLKKILRKNKIHLIFFTFNFFLILLNSFFFLMIQSQKKINTLIEMKEPPQLKISQNIKLVQNYPYHSRNQNSYSQNQFKSKILKKDLNLCEKSYEKNTIRIFEQTAPLVASIHNIRIKRVHLLSFFFNSETFSSFEKHGGSGILWDNQHIVTNAHVVAQPTEIFVTLRGKENYKAQIVGVEPRKDLAVLKINMKKKINFLTFSNRLADSSQILVGQKTLAIGSPFGLDHTLTQGIVSARWRTIPSTIQGLTIRNMIQTDAAINPGNSGGPLLDSCGRLLGLNTAIYSSTKGNAEGIGFAVPVNTVKRIVTQIIKYKKVRQPGIGVIPLNQSYSNYLGLMGVIIKKVKKNSPAERAGLRGIFRDKNQLIQIGDVITHVENIKVRNFDDFYNALNEKTVGEIVNLTVLRGGFKRNKRNVKVQLTDISDF